MLAFFRTFAPYSNDTEDGGKRDICQDNRDAQRLHCRHVGELQKEVEAHKKEVEALNERIRELTAQVAWLNRQLFGRKSERLGIIDPNQTSLFAEEQSRQMKQAEEARNEAVGKIAKTKEDRARERRNRQMMEGLPVLERVVITPEGVD